MKLTGITASTGTNALAVAINYGNKVPKIRLNTENAENLDLDKRPDFEDIVVLGRKKGAKNNYHWLAQIHSRGSGIGYTREGAFFQIEPGKYEAQKDLAPFSAYIESMHL